MSDTVFLGHLFYAYPDTERAQVQGYAGLHLQLGSLAMGLVPLNWKDRGGVSAFIGILVPRGSRRAMRGHVTVYPKGGPNGAIHRARRQSQKATG